MQLTKLIVTALASCALAAGAQQPPLQQAVPEVTGARQTRVLTAEECIKLALEHNLDIQIQRYLPSIDQYAINGAYGAFDPTFGFNASKSFSSQPSAFSAAANEQLPPNERNTEFYQPRLTGTLPSGLTYSMVGPVSDTTGTGVPPNAAYNGNPSITLTQPLLKNFWIDQNRWTILLNKNQLKTDELTLRLQIMTVVFNVKSAYYNLIFSRENVKVNAAALQLAEQLLSENRKRVEVGALAPLDEKQAQSQAASSKADLRAAEQALSVQENVLKGLITDKYAEWAEVTPVPAEQLVAMPQEINLQESWRLAIEQRPEYLQAKLAAERQNINLKYSYNQLFPQLNLTGSYGRNAVDPNFNGVLGDVANGANPAYSYGVVFSIPLGNIAARNSYKSYKDYVKQALLQLKKEEQVIVIAIDNDVKIVRSDLQRVEATREASQYAQAALEAEQKKLENGKSTSFVVLQLQSSLTTARSAEIRALADYNIAVQQLALDEGAILEKSHIEVKIK